MFRDMMEPFDPTESEAEQGVTNRGDEEGNPESVAANPEEEAVRPKAKAPPRQPSAEEVENHMVTHLPFRDWCPHCVRGKSGSKPHRNTQGVHEFPTVAIDYMFMHSNQEEGEENGMPILATKDLLNCGTGTGMMSASVLVQKGACPQAIRRADSIRSRSASLCTSKPSSL